MTKLAVFVVPETSGGIVPSCRTAAIVSERKENVNDLMGGIKETKFRESLAKWLGTLLSAQTEL